MPTNETKPTTQQLIDSLPDERQRRFLENYPIFTQVIATSKAIGISTPTFYSWLKQGTEFINAFYEVKKQAEAALLAKYEDNLVDLAFSPDVESKTRFLATAFRTKKLDPSYRDNAPVQPSYQDNRTYNVIVSSEKGKELTEGIAQFGIFNRPQQVVDGEVKQLPPVETPYNKEGE